MEEEEEDGEEVVEVVEEPEEVPERAVGNIVGMVFLRLTTLGGDDANASSS